MSKAGKGAPPTRDPTGGSAVSAATSNRRGGWRRNSLRPPMPRLAVSSLAERRITRGAKRSSNAAATPPPDVAAACRGLGGTEHGEAAGLRSLPEPRAVFFFRRITAGRSALSSRSAPAAAENPPCHCADTRTATGALQYASASRRAALPNSRGHGLLSGPSSRSGPREIRQDRFIDDDKARRGGSPLPFPPEPTPAWRAFRRADRARRARWASGLSRSVCRRGSLGARIAADASTRPPLDRPTAAARWGGAGSLAPPPQFLRCSSTPRAGGRRRLPALSRNWGRRRPRWAAPVAFGMIHADARECAACPLW